MPGPVAPFAVGRLPRITFGEGALEEVPGITARIGQRVLLVMTRSFAESSRRGQLEAGLRSARVRVVGQVVVAGEPGVADVEAALGAHRGGRVEVVVAVGGGSALDTGKAIAGLLRSGTHLLDHLEEVGRNLPYPGPAVPMVAVPTTAGTGSEATRNAVFSERGPGGYKRSFRDERLVPAEAVVDPDLLASLGQDQIAANGLDAVTQLLEAFTSTRASAFTDALAREGLAAARDSLLTWYRDPSGAGARVARSRMALAALLSGICLANAGLGAVHGLASPLGAHLPIPHGTACGAVLWQTVQANIRALEGRDAGSPALARYAVLGRLLNRSAGRGTEPEAGMRPDGSRLRADLVATLRLWVEELGIPGLSTFGLRPSDVDLVVEGSAGGSMRTNPIQLDRAELAAILRSAL